MHQTIYECTLEVESCVVLRFSYPQNNKFSLDIYQNTQTNVHRDFCTNMITRYVPVVLTTKNLRYGNLWCHKTYQISTGTFMNNIVKCNLIWLLVAYWLVLSLFKNFIAVYILLLVRMWGTCPITSRYLEFSQASRMLDIYNCILYGGWKINPGYAWNCQII
jgi:hypothetical protein